MDFGAAVSQRGYDVKTAADRFLVYSSAFRNLKIFATYTGTTTIPAAGVNTVTFTHNLGYYAPCIVIYNGSTTLGQNTSYFMSDSFSDLELNIYTDRVEVKVDDTFDNGNSAAGDTVYFTCYQFIDTFDTYAASSINSGTATGASSDDYGFRISKAGFDVKTCADVDCILSSSFFTNIIHKKGIDTTGTVAHSLGYLPAFLCYLKYDGDSFLSLNNNSFAVDTSNLYFDQLNAGDSNYYVILKTKQTA